MAETVTLGVKLELLTCHTCGAPYALTERFVRECRQVGKEKSWRCPYCGAGSVFRTSDVQRLQQELEAERNRLAAERARHDQTRAELEHTERRRRAEKGNTTKLKKRIADGICPCCHRMFQDLARHMATQHPEFPGVEEEAADHA